MTPLTSTEDYPTSRSLDALLHPAAAYDRPVEVMYDPDLTTHEKRAILASWASDARAVEACPSLRSAPGSAIDVPIDEILDALRALDALARNESVGLDRLARQRAVEGLRTKEFCNRRSDDGPSAAV